MAEELLLAGERLRRGSALGRVSDDRDDQSLGRCEDATLVRLGSIVSVDPILGRLDPSADARPFDRLTKRCNVVSERKVGEVRADDVARAEEELIGAATLALEDSELRVEENEAVGQSLEGRSHPGVGRQELVRADLQ